MKPSHIASSLIILFCYYLISCHSLAPSELIALTDLQTEFAGVSSWTTPPETACSTWDGIDCNPQGHVIQLDLEIDSEELPRFSIPFSIGGLSWLSDLDMTGCSLTGTLPTSICNISSLSSIMFQYNFLFGSIPSCLGSLSLLREFNLGNNRFSGSISQAIWSLPLMEDMNIYNNHLSGPLPNYCSMPFVSNIDISGNQLSGSLPLYFPKLGLLDALLLNDNQFDGAIPPSYGSFNSSLYVGLSNNKLSGTIPSTICNLPSGSSLEINTNNSIVPPYPQCCSQNPFDPATITCHS